MDMVISVRRCPRKIIELGEHDDEFMKLKVQGWLDAAEVLVVALPPGR